METVKTQTDEWNNDNNSNMKTESIEEIELPNVNLKLSTKWETQIVKKKIRDQYITQTSSENFLLTVGENYYWSTSGQCADSEGTLDPSAFKGYVLSKLSLQDSGVCEDEDAKTSQGL